MVCCMGYKERMEPSRREHAHIAIAAAERFSELADIADLMGDTEGAAQLRRRAASASAQAMALLDD